MGKVTTLTLADELKALAERVDLNMDKNIDLEDVAQELHALAVKCAGKVQVKAQIYPEWPPGAVPTGRWIAWFHDSTLVGHGIGADTTEALTNLQALIDGEVSP